MINSISLIGMAGAGKSAVGMQLSKMLDFKLIDSDALIESQYDKSLQKILDDEGYIKLREIENLVLKNIQFNKTILSTGGGGDVFRFIELGTELVEIESGSTENEAVGQAVRAAIEAAVYGLVIQGLEKEVWDFDYPSLGEKE